MHAHINHQALGAKLRYSVLVYARTLYRDDHGLGSMASLFQFQYEVDVKFDSFM